MTDAFTKYVELVAIPDKEAFTVATAIFHRWICRYGVPNELITDRGKEFTNELSKELFTLMDLKHTLTSARHPQCNSQAEVCNKTIASYLSRFVSTATLDWELYLPPLMFAYNTSYHRSVKNAPHFLTFGIEARSPFFNPADLRRIHYGESPAAELYQRLQHARQIAIDDNMSATDVAKTHFD
jgi:transposase InsO family protein